MVRAFSAGCLLVLAVCGSVHAAPMTRTNVDGFEVRGSGNTWTFGPAAGRPGDSGWRPKTGTSALGKLEFFKHADGSPGARGTYDLAIPGGGGRSIPVEVTDKLDKPSAARALGKFAMRVAVPITTATAFYELYKELKGKPGNPLNGSEWTFDPVGGKNDLMMLKKTIVCGPTPPQSDFIGQPSASYFNDPTITYEWISKPHPSGNQYGCVYGWLFKSDTVPSMAPPGLFSFMGQTSLSEGSKMEKGTEQELADAIAMESGWPAWANSAVVEAFKWDAGNASPELSIDPAPGSATPTVSAPQSVPGPAPTVTTEPTTKADGTPGTRTTTTTTTNNITTSGNTLNITNHTTTTTTNVYNDGTTTTETTKTEEKPAEKPEPSETCGLPNTPACKIDETGTPKPKEDTSQKDVDSALKSLKDFVAAPVSKLPTYPTLNWAFTLPTGCAAIAIPAFAPFLQSIDVCQFTPVFHDIMNVVWVMGALFGMIGTFWRSTFSAH